MKQRAVVLATGLAGYGKTTLIKALVSRTPRVLIADATDDFADAVDETFTSAGECARAVAERGPDMPFRFRILASLEGAALSAYLSKNAQPSVMDVLGPRAAAIAFQAGGCALVLDEIARWCTPNTLPPIFALLYSTSRHVNVSVLATTRRPAEIHPIVRSAADLVVAYRTTGMNDLAELRTRFGGAVDRLKTLPLFHALAQGDPACLRLLGEVVLDTRRVEVVTL